ncbi:MAG: hypothetical protein KDB66_05290 [Solirubrobacterales bacterium]|nr:hypothetical protein [Solirubrobacterales bacterium]
MAEKAPKPPAGLGDSGRDLWKSIWSDLPKRWELDEREQAVLLAACRQADDVARLEVAADEHGPMTTGSRGQAVLNPAVAEARQGRLALSRLLGQLHLPDDDEKPVTAASLRGKRAADVRWDLQRKKEARRGSSHS